MKLILKKDGFVALIEVATMRILKESYEEEGMYWAEITSTDHRYIQVLVDGVKRIKETLSNLYEEGKDVLIVEDYSFLR